MFVVPSFSNYKLLLSYYSYFSFSFLAFSWPTDFEVWAAPACVASGGRGTDKASNKPQAKRLLDLLGLNHFAFYRSTVHLLVDLLVVKVVL